MRFKDKVVLIIGGNSGIGLAAAELFAAEGAKLVITGRDPSTLGAAAARTRAIGVRCDVADLGSLDTCIDRVREVHGRIDRRRLRHGMHIYESAASLSTIFPAEKTYVILYFVFFIYF